MNGITKGANMMMIKYLLKMGTKLRQKDRHLLGSIWKIEMDLQQIIKTERCIRNLAVLLIQSKVDKIREKKRYYLNPFLKSQQIFLDSSHLHYLLCNSHQWHWSLQWKKKFLKKYRMTFIWYLNNLSTFLYLWPMNSLSSRNLHCLKRRKW